MRRRAPGLPLLGVVMLLAMPAGAQVVPGAGASIGSVAADRARLNELCGGAAREDSTRTGARILPPFAQLVYNSALPVGGNDGAMWAGRGLNLQVGTGIGYRARMGGLSLEATILPTADYSENIAFSILPGREPGRSSFSSPWHLGAASADLPLRFGDQPTFAVRPGQSEIAISTRRLALGAATTNEWWGPALFNTLVLSNNAAGIPRLFLRTPSPLRTPLGRLSARLIGGVLTESPFFDRNPDNDHRSLSGALLVLQPAGTTGLTLGAARIVTRSAASASGALTNGLDVLTQWHPLAGPGDTTRATLGNDQIASIFARWIFPASGFETYAEMARLELPRSLREALLFPQHTRAYTMGLQWLSPASPTASHLRVQAELSYLEQTTVIADRPSPDYYTGRAAIQGHTQRGQVLGAAIGPGSSSQLVGVDYLVPAWQVGAFVSRTRTENDALYRQSDPNFIRHDVRLQGGVRGARRLRSFDVAAGMTLERRLNYLFQNEGSSPADLRATDVSTTSMTLTMTPR